MRTYPFMGGFNLKNIYKSGFIAILSITDSPLDVKQKIIGLTCNTFMFPYWSLPSVAREPESHETPRIPPPRSGRARLKREIDEKYLKNILCINYICCDPLSRKPLQNPYPSPADIARRKEAVEIWKFIWKFNFSYAVKIFNISILKEHFKSFPVPRRLRKCILSELTNKMEI